jgi:SOS-response transcriptional repressor LexA
MDANEIRQRLAAIGMRQAELARQLNLSPSKMSKSLSGERRFTFEEMDTIRSILGADTPERTTSVLGSIPIIGQVAAGNWREAIQRPLASMPNPDPSIPPRAFALKVLGDSMDRYVEEGGNVIVDPDDKALFPGRFYVVINDEGETTFKQFKADPARLVPCSTNPEHAEIPIGGTSFEIVGRVIWRASRM